MARANSFWSIAVTAAAYSGSSDLPRDSAAPPPPPPTPPTAATSTTATTSIGQRQRRDEEQRQDRAHDASPCPCHEDLLFRPLGPSRDARQTCDAAVEFPVAP